MTKDFEDTLDGYMKTVASLVLPALEAAVPMHMWELQHTTDAQRVEIGHRCAELIAERGDQLMYGGKSTADVFNALAEGIAVGAFQPGGITVFGRHWCSDHAVCLGDKPQPGPDESGTDQPRRRVVDVDLPEEGERVA